MSTTYNAGDLLSTTTMSGVALGTGLDPFYGIDTTDALGLKYIFQKGQNFRVYDGTTLNKGSGTAPGTFSIAAVTASGSGYTGRYYVTVVYFDPNHEEYCTTGPYADLTTVDLFPSVSLSAQDILCTISDPPASEPRLLKARVYRSLEGTVDMRQLTGTGTYSDISVTPGGAGTHTFSDIGAAVPDATLANRDPLNLRKRYFADGLPPKGHTACFFQGRMWTVDPSNGNLIYSESNLPEDFPTDNFVTLLPSDEDPVPWTVALRVNNNQLMAYTERGCYLISGISPPFTVRALFRGVGSISTQATLFADEAGVIFPAFDAIYVHPGGSEVTRLGAPRQWPGMNPLDDLWAATDKGRGPSMCALLDRDRTLYTIACGLAQGDGVNPGGFEWDYVRSNWARVSNRVMTALGYWSNVQGRLWPVFGDEFGNIWQSEMGNYEGAPGGTLAIGADRPANTLNVSGLSASMNILGAPFLVVTTQTGVVVDANRIISISGSTLTYLYPLVVVPTYQGPYVVDVGAIQGLWQSGWWTFSRDFAKVHVNYIYPMYLLKTAGAVRVFLGLNQNTTLQPYVNPNYASISESTVYPNSSPVYQTFDKIAMDAWINQLMLRFECATAGTDWGLLGADVEGTVKRHRR